MKVTPKTFDRIEVTSENIDDAVTYIESCTNIGFDTETYGLFFKDRMFSMQLSCGEKSFYFNFHDYFDDTPILPVVETLAKMSKIFEDTSKVWYIHNAKFDMHRLFHYSTIIKGKIRDTVVWARLLWNVHFQYSLSACLKRIGLAKSDEVEKYISKHKLYDMVEVEGKSKRDKRKKYWLVPYPIMFEYGLMDSEGALQLGEYLHEQCDRIYDPSILIREEKLTKVCAKMEQRGATVVIDNVEKGWKYEQANKDRLHNELTDIAGRPFKNGPKWLSETFDQFDIPYETNPETGNPVFDKTALAKINNPIADKVKDWRRADKYIGTYYSSFKQHHEVNNGIIHANIKTGGTDTMRFSYSDPNLQNVPKEDKDGMHVYVRGCIRPREGYTLVAIDFRQQEFRLMLDYANEKRLIEAVNGGEDLHQATADLVGCTRKHAKTINFGLLYGMGVDLLAQTLGITVQEARELKYLYFAKLPKVEFFIDRVINTAKTRKYIKTWTGRRLRFPIKDYCYKAPNHLIQGGCADMVREAMVQADPVFENTLSGLLIQVHDEVVYEIHDSELDLIPQVRDIMKFIYKPFNGMQMDCSVEVSKKSWAHEDMKEIAC